MKCFRRGALLIALLAVVSVSTKPIAHVRSAAANISAVNDGASPIQNQVLARVRNLSVRRLVRKNASVDMVSLPAGCSCPGQLKVYRSPKTMKSPGMPWDMRTSKIRTVECLSNRPSSREGACPEHVGSCITMQQHIYLPELEAGGCFPEDLRLRRVRIGIGCIAVKWLGDSATSPPSPNKWGRSLPLGVFDVAPLRTAIQQE